MGQTRTIMVTGAIGALMALLLALPSLLPPAIADEEPARTLLSARNRLMPPPFDPKVLLRWDFTAEPGISFEPVKQSTVRKIAYGKTSFVDVIETTSGIYSSDAMGDPHVQYPGIHRAPAKQRAVLLVWENGWVEADMQDGSSFVSAVPDGSGNLVITEDPACAISKGDSIYC